jgi:DNA-binding transcriptional LysR family regulator
MTECITCWLTATASASRSRANTGVVSLGASQTTGTYLLPRLIAVFRQRNPQVVIRLRVRRSPPVNMPAPQAD